MTAKKAVVTGGTRGIGFAIADCLRRSGYDVWVAGTKENEKGPEETRYLACDFSDREATLKFAAELAALEPDVLINNAGINAVGPIEDYPLETFEKIQRVNVTAPFLLCRSVVPGMRERRYGRIVNITSIFGTVSRPLRFAYSASKSGLSGLTRALALETAKDNVLINCLAPGFIETGMTRDVLGREGMEATARAVPMGRLGRPEEIAVWAEFLASEKNTYMTGQTVIVDGGFTCE